MVDGMLLATKDGFQKIYSQIQRKIIFAIVFSFTSTVDFEQCYLTNFNVTRIQI